MPRSPKSIPESIAKKAKTVKKLQAADAKTQKDFEAEVAATQKTALANGEKYAKEYAAATQKEIDLRREAKAAGNIYVKPGAKIAFVVRIRGIIGINPKIRKILQLLRLRQIHNGVFVKLNKATINMLNWVEPFITYGYPSLKTVKKLCYKRGYAKVNKQRIPIADNMIIKQNLADSGIVCMEDLIHEIFTCGPNFKQANNFLWPFKLSSPLGGYVSGTRGVHNKLIHFSEGGEAGFRGVEINKFVAKLL
jgi:60S ribosomal protein uL30